jgi:hypothetical protein
LINHKALFEMVKITVVHTYDALFSILRHLWSRDDIKGTEQFSNISDLMKLLCQGLHDVKDEYITFEQMRDNICQI